MKRSDTSWTDTRMPRAPALAIEDAIMTRLLLWYKAASHRKARVRYLLQQDLLVCTRTHVT